MTDHDIRIADRYWKDMRSWSPASLTKPWSFQVNALLISSYLYYQMVTQIIDDSAYDALCSHLLKHYKEVKAAKVWHLKLVSEESLKAGSLFDLKPTDYPPVIISVCYDLIRRMNDEIPEELFPDVRGKKKKAPPAVKPKEPEKKKSSFEDVFGSDD